MYSNTKSYFIGAILQDTQLLPYSSVYFFIITINGGWYYKPQNKMFRFYKTFCSRITLINTNQNVILNPI